MRLRRRIEQLRLAGKHTRLRELARRAQTDPHTCVLPTGAVTHDDRLVRRLAGCSYEVNDLLVEVHGNKATRELGGKVLGSRAGLAAVRDYKRLFLNQRLYCFLVTVLLYIHTVILL